jgi:hypothetical protein
MSEKHVIGRKYHSIDPNAWPDYVTVGEDFGETRDYYPQRTCQMKKARWDDGQCTWGVICSACGEKHEHSFEYSFNFCPKCGAKVVDDEML